MKNDCSNSIENDTAETNDPWALYDALIGGVPRGIAVRDLCINVHWTYVEAACGTGIGHTVRGGARRIRRDFDPFACELHELAALAKSWDFAEASVGIAALNAWYAQPERLKELGAVVDTGAAAPTNKPGTAQNPFHEMRTSYAGKRVCMVGHFPNAAAMVGAADLTVLERDCSSRLDIPDSACEYVLPQADFAFLTGTTLTNKTAPRLLQLSRRARTVMVGPSAVPAPALLDAGVDVIAGSTVVDTEQAKRAVKGGSKQQWRAGIRKFTLER